MAAWWQSLSALDHVLLYIAVPATLILLIQTVLLFAGGAFDSDGDAGVPDADGRTSTAPTPTAARSTRPRRTRRPPTPACTCSPCGAWWPSWCSSAGAACGSTR